MAKTRFVQSNFVSGEISPLLKGRTDVEQYYQAVETAENVVIVPQGGLKRRPGTQYIGQAVEKTAKISATPTLPNGGSTSISVGGTTSTAYPTTTPIGTINPYVVAKYDFGSAETVIFFDIVGLALTSGQSDEFDLQYSDDDITYTTAKDLPTITTEEQTFRYYLNISARYWRLARVGSVDLGSAVVSIKGFHAREYVPSLNTQPTSLHSFSVEDDRHYLVELTPNNIRIYRTPDTYVADIMPGGNPASTLSSPEELRSAQLENVMLICGRSQRPIRLVNLGDDTSWSLDYIPFTNVPQYDYNDALSLTPFSDVQIITLSGGSLKEGDQFQIDVESVLSKNITFAGDTTTADREATVYNIQKNLQEMPVFGATGVSVARTGTLTYTVTISGESAKGFEQFTGFFTSGASSNAINITRSVQGSSRKEDVWSYTRGWPVSVCFYENRLVFGGTKSKPQSLFMSKTGDLFNFDLDDGDDDEAIFVTISSKKLNDIVDVHPGRNLQIFTSGAEFAVTSKPTTPSSINVQPQTSHGASKVEAEDIDGATIFVDRHGKRLFDFVYSFNEDAYITNDKSVLASHLINQPVDMALLSGTESDDANWLFIVNADGTATVLNTLRSQDINGFTKWSTNGDIKSVEVVDNELYMVVERGSGLYAKLYIERWDFDYKLDCSIKTNDVRLEPGIGVGGTDLYVIYGMEHLDNTNVHVIADAEGYVLLEVYTYIGRDYVTLGFDDPGYALYEVGLNFTPTIKPMPLNTNIGSGPNQMRLKKIVRMNLRVHESSGIHVDGIPVPVRQFGSGSTVINLSNKPITPVSGIIEDLYDINGWEREVMPVITCPDPTPMHIQMIEYEVEGN